MYSSIRFATAKPGLIPQVVQQLEAGFVPIIREVPGFMAYYLVNLGDDRLATVSLYESQAGVIEADARAREWFPKNLAPLMTSGMEMMGGEVLIQVS